MENLNAIENFAKNQNKSCYSYGCGMGSGDGNGYGSGYGSGNGYGRGYGYGDGYGNGNGYGRGSGYGYGNGNGSGDGNGNGNGNGYGRGSGYGSLLNLAAFCGHKVYPIDDTPTLIYSARRHYAKGAILNDDLTISPCMIAKGETSDGQTIFAHGEDIHKAFNSLQEKLYDECPVEERIVAFQQEHVLGKLYQNTDFFKWHHILTGSCQMGRDAFVKNHGIDMNGSMTVEEFISLTENDFGRDVIQKLKKAYCI